MNWMDCWRYYYRYDVSDGNDGWSDESVHDADEYFVEGSLPDFTVRYSPPAYPTLIHSP